MNTRTWHAVAAGGAPLLLALPLCGLSSESVASPPHMDLSVRLDPGTRELSAQGAITLQASGTRQLALGAQFEALELKVDGRAIDRASVRDGERQVWALDLGATADAHRIDLHYRGRLAPLAESDSPGVLGGLPPMADERGSFLPAGSGWYPEMGAEPFTYSMQLELPKGQRGLVPGRLVNEEAGAEKYRADFRFDQPAEGIDLMAGPYRVRERALLLPTGASVRLRTYFHAEIDSLAAGYLDASAGYLERYSKSIGPYPYSELSVVSSPLPTGFGMPTLTYLGIDVLRLPFIRTTSLGHEVLHNWWGNGVYVDWERGNWCEGLTTFLADYAFKEDEGDEAAREMRLGWLRDYAAVPPARDQPLRAFTSRTHDASQIVGYGKAAFLFLMLRDELGRTAFAAAIRHFWEAERFRRASWADLQRAFEQASGRNLDAFFAQWLDRTGAPSLAVEKAGIDSAETRVRLHVVLAQSEPAYRLQVPLALTTATGREEKTVDLASVRQEFAFDAAAPPRTLAIDPQYRLFRRLDAAEIPPILRQATLDPGIVILLASSGAELGQAARALAARLMDTEPSFADDGRLGPDASAVIIGLGSDVDALLARLELPARPATVGNKGTAQVWTATLTGGKVLLVVSARDAQSLQALLRPLPHYGRQSWLVFDGAKAIERGVWPAAAVSWRFE
jgi:aminopeptidase N